MKVLRGRRSIVGCDLGRSSVKLVQLVCTGGKWSVVGAELRELQPEARDGDQYRCAHRGGQYEFYP